LDEDNLTIEDMSVKIPISDNPTRTMFVAATFWIRSKEALYSAIRLMIEKEIKTIMSIIWTISL